MSAFIVGHDHIDALLTFGYLHKVSYYVPQSICNKPGGTRVDITTMTASEIGAILLTENERSVRYRYSDIKSPGDLPGTIGENAANYRFRNFGDILRLPAATKCAWILNACRCFEYQACETPDYRESLAHRIIQAIQAEAIRSLPGIDNAPWEITRESLAKAKSGA
jgi:hypothetical protein